MEDASNRPRHRRNLAVNAAAERSGPAAGDDWGWLDASAVARSFDSRFLAVD